MSNSPWERVAVLDAASALAPEMLAGYERWGVPTPEDVSLSTLAQLSSDLQTLMARGDELFALGAGKEMIEVALMVASFPSQSAASFDRKEGLLEGRFGSLVRAFDHGHVATIVEAALAAERALRAGCPLPAGVREPDGDCGRPAADEIPSERLGAYALNAVSLRDLEELLAAFVQASADKEALRREKRKLAFDGAKDLSR